MLGAVEAAGSGSCGWKPVGQKAPSLGCPVEGRHCAVLRLLQSFALQARAGLYEQEPLCSLQCLLTRQ